jgi:NADH dehydrogenase (ubiquinone) 1 alpha subcomplex subunit 13
LGGFATFVVTGAVLVLGFLKVTKFNGKRKDDFDEMRQARLHILPYLQAESDRRYLRMKKQALEEEAKIMKDVPGWVVGESVYKTPQWIPPSK